MASVSFPEKQPEERFGEFVRAPGTQVAGAVLVADSAAMVLDNNGFVGFLLFGAGIVAALYLLARWLHGPATSLVDFIRRPRGTPPVFVPPRALLTAALALIPTTIGANLFKNTGEGLEDALNLLSFLGFVSVLAFFAVIAVATAVAWAGQDGRR